MPFMAAPYVEIKIPDGALMSKADGVKGFGCDPEARWDAEEMIKEAIAALKDRTGSSSVAIAKYIEEKHGKSLPPNFKKMLSVQLRGSAAKGKLVKVKASYKLSDAAKKDSPKAKAAAKPAKDAAKPKKKDAAKPKKKDAAKTKKNDAAKPKKKAAAAGAKRKAPEKKLIAKAKKSPAAKAKAKPKTVKSPAAKKARKVAAA
ncbi:histone H1-like [Lolium rigidum]|uniref:histone H1-like n=1 Tax=Lolium rigidum TaxID=89674 RepID=UPI001F5D3A44|nr:histone H1-like [Lolium rigidum]